MSGLYRWLKAVYDGEKHHKLALAYDLFMAAVIIVAITITLISFKRGASFFDDPWIRGVDLGAVALFNIDYWGGFILCDDKRAYFKKNFFDLFTLIPVNQIWSVFRAFKIIQLLRIFQVIRVVGAALSIRDEMKKFMRLNGFIYILGFTVGTIGIGSVAIYIVEKGETVETFYDAIWWTIVTTTTVGYGDISPATGLGRVIAVVLMFTGIGFIGTLTGSITSFFTEKLREQREEEQAKGTVQVLLDKTLSDSDGSELDLSDLTDEEYLQVISYIKFLKAQHEG